jgi:hypothetical protein
VKEEDAATYEDVLCSGRSDHRDGLLLCFCSAELLRFKSAQAGIAVEALHTYTTQFVGLSSPTVNGVHMPKRLYRLSTVQDLNRTSGTA